MLHMCYALILPGVILSHWRGDDLAQVKLGLVDDFSMPAGFAQSFCDILLPVGGHTFQAYIVISGFVQSREPDRGWFKTLAIYLLYAAMQWPLMPVAAHLGAPISERYHQ